jgi:steroid delta-isomerase-like uncharacterized protein
MHHQAAIVRQIFDEILNRGDIEATAKYFHEDVVEQVPFPGQGPGIAGLKAVLSDFRRAFPDICWTVEEQIEEGATVVTRFVWSGTHHDAFLGIPGTGRMVSVWGVVIDHFFEARIKETRIIMDVLGLMGQLGVLPPPQP